MEAEYFQKQADQCRRLAHECQDLTVARKLSELANQLRAKAQELAETTTVVAA